MNDLPPYDEAPEWGYDAEPAAEASEAAAGAPKTLPFFWFKDAEPDLEANDFVEGLLTSGAMSVVYGPSNCGKTFFIVDLALHVAWGRPWRNREVDRGAIVYLSLEGAQGIRNRLAAFRRHHNVPGLDLPFVAMPQPVNLLDNDADVHAVIALVKHVAEQTGLTVAMVIIDTLSRAMAGGNENSPEDMTALIGNCDAIRHATGSHVCIVHHSGKDEARGARGHSSLRAATDTEIEIKRDPELTLSSVRIAKQRDLEAGDPFNFTLQSVALGDNRRGKPVTSCVVMEPDQQTVIGRSPDKLSDKELVALEALDRIMLTAGFETVTSRNNQTVTAVSVGNWRRHLSGCGVTDPHNRDVSRVQFNRIKKALISKGKIHAEGEVVWFA
nr:helicase RepA family protein [Novosphingobium olei]